jgi:hypothetical protein
MADAATPARARRRGPRRLRRLALLVLVVALIAIVRSRTLASEQQAFDERYGPGAERGST